MKLSWQAAPFYLTAASAVSTLFSIAICQILLGMALGLALVLRQPLRLPPIKLPLALFFVGTLLSDVVSGHVALGYPEIKKFYVFFILVMVYTTFSKLVEVRLVVMILAGVGLLSSLWAIVQFYEKYGEAQEAHQSFYTYYNGDRITGFMSHWMTFSGEMMIVLLLMAALLFFSGERRWTLWLLSASAIIALALALSWTRTIWLGAACGGLYLLWCWRRWLIVITPVPLVLLLWLNPANIGDRMRSAVSPHGSVDSNQHRYICRRVGWEMIKAHPWFGVGPHEVGPQFDHYLPADIPLPKPPGYYAHLHNIYFQYAAERGVPTMLTAMWMLGKMLFDFLRARRRLPGTASDGHFILYGAIAVIIGILVSGFWEFNLGDSEVLTLFLAVAGFGYVAVGVASQEKAVG